MKRGLVIILCTIFLVSFVFATPSMTGSATNGGNQNQVQANSMNANGSTNSEVQEQERLQERELSEYQVRAIKRTQNRLQANTELGNCPETCVCDGSATKCQLENGSREMTIRAGKSGNTIVQVKNANMSTRVELYRAKGKIYGVFKGNQTKELKVLPDQIMDRLRERIRARLEAHNITLDENGTYQIQAKKRARLFFIIPVRERVRLEMNSETGELVKIKNSWWGWMAKDVPEEPLVGGCGTVTPGLEDECCQNQGYAFWDAENGECAPFE